MLVSSSFVQFQLKIYICSLSEQKYGNFTCASTFSLINTCITTACSTVSSAFIAGRRSALNMAAKPMTLEYCPKYCCDNRWVHLSQQYYKTVEDTVLVCPELYATSYSQYAGISMPSNSLHQINRRWHSSPQVPIGELLNTTSCMILATGPMLWKYESIHKPEVLQCYQRRTEPQPHATCIKIWSSAMWFLGYASGQTDRQTDILITILRTSPGGEVTTTFSEGLSKGTKQLCLFHFLVLHYMSLALSTHLPARNMSLFSTNLSFICARKSASHKK